MQVLKNFQNILNLICEQQKISARSKRQVTLTDMFSRAFSFKKIIVVVCYFHLISKN